MEDFGAGFSRKATGRLKPHLTISAMAQMLEQMAPSELAPAFHEVVKSSPPAFEIFSFLGLVRRQFDREVSLGYLGRLFHCVTRLMHRLESWGTLEEMVGEPPPLADLLIAARAQLRWDRLRNRERFEDVVRRLETMAMPKAYESQERTGRPSLEPVPMLVAAADLAPIVGPFIASFGDLQTELAAQKKRMAEMQEMIDAIGAAGAGKPRPKRPAKTGAG